MKKLVLGCFLVLCTVSLFNACSKDSKDDPILNTNNTSNTSNTNNSGNSNGNGSGGNTTTDTVVVINGVKWATRNVAAPGKFAVNCYDAGDFYQWNSKIGWSSSNPLTPSDGTSTWNSSWKGGYSSPSGTDTWTSTNDPSPAGWRVPTYAEIQTLLDATKVTGTFTTQNSIYGEKFTDKTTGNSIFLPASGYRYFDVGTLYSVGSLGYYWSGSAYYSDNACSLYFSSTGADWSSYGRAVGLPVRPVAK